MRERSAGFTLIEVTMVIALMLISSTVAIVQLKSSVAAIDANTASSTVISQLKYARQLAVDQRRNVRVDFTSPATITVTRIESDGTGTILASTDLPAGYTFGLPGLEDDTPDAYGNTAPVYFNNEATGTFLGDGIFVDTTGIVLSGTVFTIGAGDSSARAVTLAGTSGRTRLYSIKDGAWAERR